MRASDNEGVDGGTGPPTELRVPFSDAVDDPEASAQAMGPIGWSERP